MSSIHCHLAGLSLTKTGMTDLQAKRGGNSREVRLRWRSSEDFYSFVHRLTTSKMLPPCALVVYLWNRVNASFLPTFHSLNKQSLEHELHVTVSTYSPEPVEILALEESLWAALIQIVARAFPQDYPRELRSDLQWRKTQTYYQFLWGLTQFALR